VLIEMTKVVIISLKL